MKCKKGDSTGFQFIIVFSVTIVAAIMYLVWLGDYRIYAENLEDYTICKNSNLENAKLKLRLSNQVIDERKGNKCKTEYLTTPKGKELEMTAKKMANCWDMYLEGKEDIFETEDNNYCAICSVITYSAKGKMNGLTAYLIEHNVPNKNKKYYSYLTRTIVEYDEFTELQIYVLNELNGIDASKPMAVIFTMGKNANPGSLTGQSSIVTAGEGAVAGSVLASAAVVAGYGLCTTGVGCLVGAFLVGAGTGGATGYFIGSPYSPNTDTKIVLWPYTNSDLAKLNCTVLEGKDQLEIKKF